MKITCDARVGGTLLHFTIDPDMPRNQQTVSSVSIYHANGQHSMLAFYNRGGSTGCWNKVLADDAFNIAARLLGCLTADVQAAFEQCRLPF